MHCLIFFVVLYKHQQELIWSVLFLLRFPVIAMCYLFVAFLCPVSELFDTEDRIHLQMKTSKFVCLQVC